jgi:ABC-type transport system substrate-binding protein
MRSRHLNLTLLIFVGWLTACANTGQEELPQPANSPVRGGTLHIAQIAPLSIDPAFVDDSYEAALVNQIHDGLLRHDGNLNLLPSLATSWRISRDSREYRFERLSTEGDYVLTVRLEQPYASFLHAMASELARVVPHDYVVRHGDEILSTAPVGAGPFRLVSWTAGEEIVLERFDDYHAGPAYLDRIVVHTPPDPVQPRAIAAFRRGELHMVDLTLSGRQGMPEIPEQQLHRRRELSLTFLAFNTRRAPLDDPDVRRAIAHSINIDRLTGIGKGGQAIATGVLPPGFPGYTPETKRLPFDPQLAIALLSESLDPESMPGEIRIAAPKRGTEADLLIEDICHQLRAVGLPARADYLDWDRLRSDVGRRSARPRRFLLPTVSLERLH